MLYYRIRILDKSPVPNFQFLVSKLVQDQTGSIISTGEGQTKKWKMRQMAKLMFPSFL